MKSKLFYLFFIVGTCILSSCHHDTPTTNCVNTFTYLAGGHTFHYTITDGFVSDTSLDVTITATSASDVFQATNVSDQGSFNASTYFHACSDKLYTGASVGAAQTSTNYERVNNASLNTTWTESGNNTSYVYTVVGKNVSVTVFAGTFTCDKVTYHETGTINTDTIYCNAAIGDVKYVGTLFSYELQHKNY